MKRFRSHGVQSSFTTVTVTVHPRTKKDKKPKKPKPPKKEKKDE